VLTAERNKLFAALAASEPAKSRSRACMRVS
jgi:hypothetical protein